MIDVRVGCKPLKSHCVVRAFVQFTKAVEAKQVAQQDAERARFVVLKADQARPTALYWPSFLTAAPPGHAGQPCAAASP